MASSEQNPNANLKRKRENGEHKRNERNRKRKRASIVVEENGLPSGRPQAGDPKPSNSKDGFGWAPKDSGQKKDLRSKIPKSRKTLTMGEAIQPEELSKHQKRKLKRKLNHKNKPRDAIESMEMSIINEVANLQPAISKVKTDSNGNEQSLAIKTPGVLNEYEPKKSDTSESWIVSSPMGGNFIDARPLFSNDEKFVIIATETAVHIYSTSTSLLLHSLLRDADGSIVAYSLSQSNSEVLYIGTSSGQISSWNWVSATHIGTWETETEILDLSMIVSADSEHIAYTLNKSGDFWTVVAHYLGSEENDREPRSSLLLSSKKPLLSFRVLEAANTIVVAGEKFIIVGRTAYDHTEPLYEWRELESSEAITCFDVRYMPITGTNDEDRKKSASTHLNTPDMKLDVAIGGLQGSIYIYDDLINKLHFAKDQPELVEHRPITTPRHLHWHRQAVGSVSWSRDGNYVISGGEETVLVLWQLDTGKQQFLPHLESPIQDINVSPTGSSYAIRLGDNSVMVLSTTELQPIANFAGIQCQNSIQKSRVATIPKIKTSHERNQDPLLRVAGANDPNKPYRIFLSVPAAQSRTGWYSGIKPDPYLQTFDVLNDRHISRQALTRTNATNTNLGPNGATILEPSLKHLQVSCNGQWLATIDEWSPWKHDVEDITADDDDVQAAIDCQREVSLRFWSWDESRQQWTLNSRITVPHPCGLSERAGRVFDLKADPQKLAFATIGEDSCVRTWRSYSSNLDANTHLDKTDNKGIEATPAQTRSWWAQELSIPAKKDSINEHLDIIHAEMAILAYSNDGSTIAAHQSFPFGASAGGIVEFIDVASGTTKETRSCLPIHAGSLEAMAFLERHLICVGQRGAVILDVTSFNLVNYIEFQPAPQIVFDYHLAVNLATSTFAISYPEISAESNFAKALVQAQSQGHSYNKLAQIEDLQGRLKIYSPMSQSPLLDTVIPHPATLLLPVAGAGHQAHESEEFANIDKKGYIVLDCSATIRTIKPRGYVSQHFGSPADHDVVSEPIPAQVEQPLPEQEAMASPDDSDVDTDTSATTADNMDDSLQDSLVPAEKAVVRPEQLAEIFDYPSVALPSVKSMFYSVLKLYAGK